MACARVVALFGFGVVDVRLVVAAHAVADGESEDERADDERADEQCEEAVHYVTGRRAC